MEWAFLDFDGKPNTAFLGSLCWEEVGGIEKCIGLLVRTRKTVRGGKFQINENSPWRLTVLSTFRILLHANRENV